MIEIFKKAELPEIIAQHVPNGFTDEQIVRLLDHLFDIVIEKGRSADKNLLKIFGGHVNLGGLIQDSETLQFLDATTPKIIDGFYNKAVAIKTPLGKFHSYKTYFPNDWTSECIVQYIVEHLKDAKFILRDDGKLESYFYINEKIKLAYFFDTKLKFFDSIYPILTK